MRYHLNIRNGVGLIEDEDGRDLSDLESARREAVDGIRSLVSEEVKKGFIDLTGQIEIVDDDGNLLGIVRYDEAVALIPVGRTP
jgi:hypothetical protein